MTEFEGTRQPDDGALRRLCQRLGSKVMDFLGVPPCPSNEELSDAEHKQILSRYVTGTPQE